MYYRAVFLLVLLLALPSPSLAQLEECPADFEGKIDEEDIYEDVEKPENNDYMYEAEDCVVPEDMLSSAPITCRENVRSLNKLEEYIKREKEGGEQAARLAAAQKDVREWEVGEEKKEGPQDYREEYLKDGHLPVELAWKRFVADSLRTLDITEANEKKWSRFWGCLEPKRIKKDPKYIGLCSANCPALVPPPAPCGCPFTWPPILIPQSYELYSYYLPVYTIILGKDGHRFIDPTMLEPQDQKRPDLTLDEISKAHDEHIDSNILPQLEEKGLATDKFERAAWHKDGERLFLEGWENSDIAPMQFAMSAGGIRTNWVARFSNARQAGKMHHGYLWHNKCMAWAMPESTDIRKVLTNYMEAEAVLNDLKVFPEFTAIVDRTKYKLVHFYEDPDLKEAGEEVKPEDPGEALKSIAIIPKWRKWRWPGSGAFGVGIVGGGHPGDECGAGFGDLEILGFEEEEDIIDRYDVIYWAFETSPFTNTQWWTNPLVGSIANAGRAALVLGNPHPSLQEVNTDDRRHYQFTYYGKRHEKPKVCYMNTRTCARNDENTGCRCADGNGFCGRRLIGLDKYQVVFPPVPPNRGNECFTLNTVPRRAGDANFPKSLITFFKQYGLVHITQWDYRVVCACEVCGLFQGCLTLNNGDNPSDVPEGNDYFEPESMKQVQGMFKGFAENTEEYKPPSLLPCEFQYEFSIPGSVNKGEPTPVQRFDDDWCQGGGGG